MEKRGAPLLDWDDAQSGSERLRRPDTAHSREQDIHAHNGGLLADIEMIFAYFVRSSIAGGVRCGTIQGAAR